MKQLIYIRSYYTLALIASFSLFVSCSSAQKVTITPEQVNTSVKGDQWRFNAERAEPQTGGSRILNTQYWVELKDNNAVFELPYFGRAQGSIGMPGSTGPLEFSTKDFSLSKSQNDKGAWTVLLKPKDNTDVLSASFTIFENGRASLNVILSNRSPISYSGYIEPVK